MELFGGVPPQIRTSGQRSAPFGQTTVPDSTLTCRKATESLRRVSNIGPISRLVISRSTIDPSVSVSRRRKPSTGMTSRIRSKDTGESPRITQAGRWVRACGHSVQDPNPAAVRHDATRPILLLEPALGEAIHPAPRPRCQFRSRLHPPHRPHESWRVMVIEVHPDDNTEETTEFRHPHLSEPFVAAAEYPFPRGKSPRPFGEVLSYEFWVLSCLVHH